MIGTGVGLREAEGDQLLARSEVREPAVLLLGRPGDLDRDRAQRLDGEDQARRGAVAAQLLDREAQRQQVGAQAAVLLLERDREDVVLGEEPAHVLGPLGRPVDRRGAGCDLLVGELPDRIAQQGLLLGQAHGTATGG